MLKTAKRRKQGNSGLLALGGLLLFASALGKANPSNGGITPPVGAPPPSGNIIPPVGAPPPVTPYTPPLPETPYIPPPPSNPYPGKPLPTLGDTPEYPSGGIPKPYLPLLSPEYMRYIAIIKSRFETGTVAPLAIDALRNNGGYIFYGAGLPEAGFIIGKGSDISWDYIKY